MLRVTMLSGEQVASIPVMELSDVRSLKQRLHRLHNFPTRFRQRLLHEGSPLGDDAKLDSIAHLELLLLSYHPTSQSQANELVTAAMNGFVDQVEALLQKPQNPDSTDAFAMSPLTVASSAGNIDIVRLLLEAGADKDVANNNGITALMIASQTGHLAVARLLLEAGADKEYFQEAFHRTGGSDQGGGKDGESGRLLSQGKEDLFSEHV
ncbi:Ankyrin repeat domain-containing protein 39 [Symbiodinium microadriaticum]|uniref:Ankyrin repeat domain-containing protein 39 n=1 Tax=Symbiodinium microadriaticum TaxID=2951 RepID=A0A1Q9ERP3_SYMMI|nr:Ankyrin repeat domain-containing protein 39 [Symbiodinium microadriaticum]